MTTPPERTVNVGVVHAGTRPNVVAAQAEAHVDVRGQTLAEAARIDAAIRGLLPHVLGATSCYRWRLEPSTDGALASDG